MYLESDYDVMRSKYKSLKRNQTEEKARKKYLKEWVKQRDIALNTGLEAFKSFCIADDRHLPDDAIFEVAFYKCRYNSLGVYPKLRKDAKQWLNEHGYSEEIN